MTPGPAPRLVIIFALLAMIGPFTIDTVFPGFASIERQFSIGEAESQQITSIYLLSFAVMSLLHGPISDAVGRKPVIAVSMLIYVVAAIGCALSVSLPMLLAFRALQGFAAGGGQIISRAMVRDLYSGPTAQKLMSQVMMIFTIAPALAPVLGGVLLQAGDWPIIFWFLAAFGLFVAALSWFGLPESHPVQDRRPLRLRPLVSGLVQVAVHGSFMRLALAGSLAFASQFVYIVSAPIFVVRLLGRGEQDFWIFFVPMITGMLLGALVSSRLAGRVPATRLATVGFSLAVVAGVINCVLSALPGAPYLPWAVLTPPLVGFGSALFFPVVQLTMLDIFPAQRGSAASMGSFITLLINAILAGVVAPLVTGTVLQLALTSLGFAVVGWLLWTWHRRSHPDLVPATG